MLQKSFLRVLGIYKSLRLTPHFQPLHFRQDLSLLLKERVIPTFQTFATISLALKTILIHQLMSVFTGNILAQLPLPHL